MINHSGSGRSSQSLVRARRAEEMVGGLGPWASPALEIPVGLRAKDDSRGLRRSSPY